MSDWHTFKSIEWVHLRKDTYANNLDDGITLNETPMIGLNEPFEFGVFEKGLDD